VKGIKFSKHCSWTASVGVETSESVCFLYSVLKHVTRGFIFLFIYIELSLRVWLFIINYKGKAILFKTRESKFRVNRDLETPWCCLEIINHARWDTVVPFAACFACDWHCAWLKISSNIGRVKKYRRCLRRFRLIRAKLHYSWESERQK
jgi:hypothetical protein